MTTSFGFKRINIEYLYLVNSLCAALFWVCFLSRGFHTSGILDGFTELQAHALSQGHLYILPGSLKKLYYDASMYHGKYYLYWGIFPSLVYLVFFKVFGRVVASYLVCYGFLFCLVYFFQKIIADIVDCAVKNTHPNPYLWRMSSLPLLWLFIFNLPFSSMESTWFFGRFYI